MIVLDMQPASIVNDKGFQDFLKVMDSKYIPPSRRTIMRNLLPDMYEHCKQSLMEALEQVEYCALTTDLWTSRATESYLTVTCHYITGTWELRASVLETAHVPVAHTAENLAAELTRITTEWNISNKVACVVTDGCSNVVAAIRLNNWNHLHCFAHLVNLIVSDSVNAEPSVLSLQKKCQDIVSYFHKSSKATDKLTSIQNRLNIENHKLIQYVETRWNSTFYMFERIIEQHEAITTTLCLLNKSSLCISPGDIGVLKEVVELLKPFEEITRELSGEDYISLSMIIPLATSVQHITSGSRDVSVNLGDKLCLQMRKRFLNMESNSLLASATLLDPRMKKLGFHDAGCSDQAVRRVIGELKLPDNQLQQSEQTLEVGQSGGEANLWQFFDLRVSESNSKRTPNSDALVEMRQYTQLKHIERKEDPLAWWRENASVYPKLQLLAKKYLCIPGTSVPSERLFSKAGELISNRRSQLKPKNVNMILFLNKN